MTITEFLLRRISEDEAGAQAALRDICSGERSAELWEWEYAMLGDGGALNDSERHISRWWPKRVLAECEAKRRFLLDTQPFPLTPDMNAKAEYNQRGAQVVHDQAVRVMASIYSDHPDYQQEWVI